MVVVLVRLANQLALQGQGFSVSVKPFANVEKVLNLVVFMPIREG